MFSRHRVMFESGKLNTEFSKLYFFLSSITDQTEEINKYMGSVNIHLIDIAEKEFGENFNHQNWIFFNEEKAILKNILKKIIQISNTNIVKNAEGSLNKMPTEIDIEWIGKSKIRLPENQFKVSY